MTPADASTPPAAPTTFLRAAMRPRMLVLLAALLLAAVVCARLGMWQLDRAEIRGGADEAQEQAEREARPPQDIGAVFAPQTSFAGELVGQQVVARGVYEPDGQLLVVERSIGEEAGYLVLTPLRVTDTLPSTPGDDVGEAAPVLPVVRGWVADPDDAAALAVPAGEVTVTGYLQASEGPGLGGQPAGRVDAISSAELLGSWAGPIWTGYVVLADVSPADPAHSAGLQVVPAPTRSGSGMNIQNLAYAAQWWIFGGFALFVWVRLVRDEAAGDGPATGEPQAATTQQAVTQQAGASAAP